MKKVLLVAPVMSRSGYGEMGRFALRSMISNPSIDLYVHNIKWGKTGWVWKDNEERQLIDSLLQKSYLYRQSGGKFDATVQCTIPNEWQNMSPHDIGYTAGIETDKVSPEWLVKGNEVNKIITISKHSANVFKKTTYAATDNHTGEKIEKYKCKTEIEHVGFPVKSVTTEDIDINLKHDFNFLCIAQLGPRKNVDAVINNFIEEFKNEEVGLLLKLFGSSDSVIDYHDIKPMFDNIASLSKKEGWKCSINLLHGNLTDEQMSGLYTHPKVKAFVSLSHGEGFGLPLYEAAYNNLPVIATDWSGHLDFLSIKTAKRQTKYFAAVKYTLKEIPQSAVWNTVLQADSKWAYPDDKDAKKKMRDVFKNYSKWVKKAEKLSSTFKGEQYWYDRFNKALNLETNDE